MMILVGGFNHLEKYESQWEGLSHMEIKTCLKPPTRYGLKFTGSSACELQECKPTTQCSIHKVSEVSKGLVGFNGIQWDLGIAKLVNITLITKVYDIYIYHIIIYNILKFRTRTYIHGGYTPTSIAGDHLVGYLADAIQHVTSSMGLQSEVYLSCTLQTT